MKKLLHFSKSFTSLAVLYIVWEISGIFDVSFVRVVPPPSQFLFPLFQNNFKLVLGSESVTVLGALFASLARVSIGMSISFVLALITSISMHSYSWAHTCLMPLFRLFAPIAPLAWIPIILFFFGIGNSSAILLVFLGVYFILTISFFESIEEIPKKIVRAVDTLGTKLWQKYFYVVVPYLAPRAFRALRINFMTAWMALLVAEMIGLNNGLGYILNIGRNLFNYDLMMLGIFLIGVTGFFIDSIMKFFQKKYLWW